MGKCYIALAFLVALGLYVAAFVSGGSTGVAVADQEAAALYGGTCPQGDSTTCGEQGQPPSAPCNGVSCFTPAKVGVSITCIGTVSCGGGSCGKCIFGCTQGALCPQGCSGS
jgi:hypothetical protein